MSVADVLASKSAATARRASLLALIREDVACVRQRDPAARGQIETLLTDPGVHAVIWHRVANRLWVQGWRAFARHLLRLGRLLTNVHIHPGARIGRWFFIDHGAGVVIGETAEIGDDATLYHSVTLGGTIWSPSKRRPTLGDRVVVGAGPKILGPITIGARGRVDTNSVVIESTPSDVTVVGIPARAVRPALDRGRVAGRIDLDHHLMPGAVGDATAALLDRMEFIERRARSRAEALAEAEARPLQGDSVSRQQETCAHSPIRTEAHNG